MAPDYVDGTDGLRKELISIEIEMKRYDVLVSDDIEEIGDWRGYFKLHDNNVTSVLSQKCNESCDNWNRTARLCYSMPLTCYLCAGTGGTEEEERAGGHKEFKDCDKCYGSGIDQKRMKILEYSKQWTMLSEEEKSKWGRDLIPT